MYQKRDANHEMLSPCFVPELTVQDIQEDKATSFEPKLETISTVIFSE
jgi:hypothetical protein